MPLARLFSVGAALALAFGGLSGGAPAAAAVAAKADGIAVDNAEDLAPIAGDHWVIASSMAGGPKPSGALVAVDVRSGRTIRLYPSGQGAGASTTPDCPREVPADMFKPHGISLKQNRDGQTRLFVVNHGSRESVEFFALDEGGATPALRWIGCAILPPGPFGNAVTVGPDDTLYMTNMGKPLGGGPAVSEMGGDVLSWRAGDGWRTVPDSVIIGPNGIVAAPDGKRLYVASWPGGALIELTLGDGATTRRTVALDFLPDNVKLSAAGALLATGHLTSAKTVAECYVSNRAQCPIPSATAEIDPGALAVRCTRRVALDMATVAVTVGTETWIGTARGNHVERLAGADPCPAR